MVNNRYFYSSVMNLKSFSILKPVQTTGDLPLLILLVHAEYLEISSPFFKSELQLISLVIIVSISSLNEVWISPSLTYFPLLQETCSSP